MLPTAPARPLLGRITAQLLRVSAPGCGGEPLTHPVPAVLHPPTQELAHFAPVAVLFGVVLHRLMPSPWIRR